MTIDGLTFHLETYGCQMNVHDSMVIAGLLRGHGLRSADGPGDAQVLILNTCAVREKAEERVYGRLNDLARLRHEGNLEVLGVSGCMAQRTAARILERSPAVDFITGTDAFVEIPGIVERVLGGERPIVDVSEGRPAPRHTGRALEPAGFKAFVSVMRGCDKRCAFCVVPTTRGPERSRPVAEIVEETRALVDAGVREITLLGQTVNSYRHDGRRFGDLLRAVEDVRGLERIRFTTSHPGDMDDETLEAVALCPKVCEHLHLPAQSGSSRVLGAMGRGYTREEYLGVVRRARELIPGVSVTTDLIVGFPGESDAEFAETISLVREARFDSAFTFKYSAREGTPAAAMAGAVSAAVKGGRLASLNDVVRETASAVCRSLVGSEQEIVVEAPREEGVRPGRGRTRTNRALLFEKALGPVGSVHRVRVTGSRGLTLLGVPVTTPTA
jgi:tRNA-2-methylthio-N6-dimethylallyladenosine synthase